MLFEVFHLLTELITGNLTGTETRRVCKRLINCFHLNLIASPRIEPKQIRRIFPEA